MHHRHWTRLLFVIVTLALLPFASAVAGDGEAAAEDSPSQQAWAAAAQALQRGPKAIALRDQATLNLPDGYGFVPTREASAVMDAMGNTVDGNFIGLILPLGEDDNWLVSVDFDPAGYINDDDAKHWNADELLDSLKQGTEAGNEHRIKLGVTPIEVTRWIEAPAYDSASQHLVWSAEARDKGAAPGSDNTVNYNTYVLGRDGYISLNLITNTSQIEAQKPVAKSLLRSVAFVDGKRYADFNASTDKVAGYGLAALVGGVAAKKLGLFALAGAFLAKFAKVIIVAVAAAGAALRKFLGGKRA